MGSKPRDSREFVRMHVGMPSHPKLAEIDSPLAGWLYCCGIFYAGEHHTDGHVKPRIVERTANVPRKWTRELLRVGLWHEAGHDCPKCPQPAPGDVYVHDYLEHNRSRAEAEDTRAAAKSAAQARWDAVRAAREDEASSLPLALDSDADRMPDASAAHSGTDAVRNAEAEAEAECLRPLLTLVGRLTKRTRDDQRLPAEVIASWQEYAGTGVDLDAEARSYLARYVSKPATDELAAWLGWLDKARAHAERRRGEPPPAPDTVAPPAASSRRPPDPRPTVPCPDHSAEPAGHCRECVAAAKPAPAAIVAVAERRRRSHGARNREAS